MVAVDIDAGALRETVGLIASAGGRAVAVPGDVAEPDVHRRAVDAAREVYGGLHILYCNAGMVARGPDGDLGLEAVSLATWDRILAVNLTGAFLTCRAGIPAIVASGGGSVILTASVGALVGQRAHNHAYVASKTALVGLARNLALEYAGKGVRVNCLCPGQIRTAMMAELYEDPARRAWFEAMTPMGRFGEPQEVAAAALFLASDESSFMTGAVLVVDGGWTAH